MFIYPIHILATNRILSTVISRHNQDLTFRSIKDIKDIYRLRGIKAFFYGLFPYTLNFVFANTNIKIDPPMIKSEIGLIAMSLLTYNPLNILIVRMQCLEYPHRKLRNALTDMIIRDRLSMFYRGFLSIICGQMYIAGSFSMNEWLKENFSEQYH
jgi:hypothetical protein